MSPAAIQRLLDVSLMVIHILLQQEDTVPAFFGFLRSPFPSPFLRLAFRDWHPPSLWRYSFFFSAGLRFIFWPRWRQRRVRQAFFRSFLPAT